MDIFCRSIPPQINYKHLRKKFEPVLKRFGIDTFHCRKAGKTNAILTILDLTKAQKVLDCYGQDQKRTRKPANLLKIFDRPTYLTKASGEPDKFLLRSLAEEQEDAHHKGQKEPATEALPAQLPILNMRCGYWTYANDGGCMFVDCYRLPFPGTVVFGKTTLRAYLTDPSSKSDYQIQFPYSHLTDSMYLGGGLVAPSVTVVGDVAPRFYVSNEADKLVQHMAALYGNKGQYIPTKRRVGSLGGIHEDVAGTCFTYRFRLRESHDILRVRKLGDTRYIPSMNNWVDRILELGVPYPLLLQQCQDFIRDEKIPYSLKFQMQALVWNGVLDPTRAKRLYPYILQVLRDAGASALTQGLQRLVREVQYPSPDVDHGDTEIAALVELLQDCVENASRELKNSLNIRNNSPSNVSVYKTTVTPSGVYLYGPKPETKNRVLRRYADHIDHFLRVEFVDESGERLNFEPGTSLDDIFDHRFRSILRSGIEIGDRRFSFLGFSHSSLRSQACWFVAPFHTSSGDYFDAGGIIREIGSFEDIRSPAKQAARIGQAFSDTLTSIAISRDCIDMNAPDIRREDRVFSDGVGTISTEVMYKIWNEYALQEPVKPTVFQIRIGGAKGMISLDTRMKGEYLKLRKSMVKFPSKGAWNIEICGAGIKALPFYLNNQLIKILEDLGVPSSAFLKLQADEIRRLRSAVASTRNAMRFLDSSNIAKSVQLPWLIRILAGFGLKYSQDDFLRRVMQVAILVKLRDLKYRARIPVPKAVTLYGIMDETGYLQEGEIFCSFLSDRGFRQILVKKSIAVTRSPALHPGDVQIVNAVDVPENSPLRKLHNCVAFSQHGTRDLPSMLSGGDLDGDLYNIIYDNTLIPGKVANPADYARPKPFDLGRPVAQDDVVSFFLTFMQQDQLGRIATAHQIFADQKENGTHDSNCLVLAELHSTAVDFSKTGTEVDIKQIPRAPRNRPDFLAPGPRVRVAEGLEMLEETADMMVDDGDDDERAPLRYYKSSKTLGHLFRNVDEKELLAEIQEAGRSSTGSLEVLQAVWSYVEDETEGFQWDHLVKDVREIKEIYEDNLQDLMWNYSETPWKSSITEIEVFIGTILGHNHKQSRQDKESSKDMRAEYEALVDYTVSGIRDREGGGEESLERSIACLWVALHPEDDTRHRRARSASATRSRPLRRAHQEDKLLSFPWIAAITCLKEVDRFQRKMRV